jgi:hypothetical protein
MIVIDKSHSKMDLIELFESLQVNIPKKYKKQDIIANLPQYIQNAKYNNKVKDVSVLIDILKNKSTKQRPNLKLKNIIMHKSKRIIKYCSSNHVLSNETYLSHEDVYNDVMYIANYGDIASVRKALNLYNNSPYCINHVNPILSDNKIQEIAERKLLKKNKVFGLKSKRSPILLEFL